MSVNGQTYLLFKLLLRRRDILPFVIVGIMTQFHLMRVASCSPSAALNVVGAVKLARDIVKEQGAMVCYIFVIMRCVRHEPLLVLRALFCSLGYHCFYCIHRAKLWLLSYAMVVIDIKASFSTKIG